MSAPPHSRGNCTPSASWIGARDGGIAIAFAIMLGVLAGLAALVVDLSRAYTLSTELESAADAYALAGATQLDQRPGACTRALRAAGEADLANTETFASNGAADGTVFLDPTLDPFGNENIRFLVRLVKDVNGQLVGDYVDDLYTVVSECDAHAKFIEVTIDRSSSGDPYRVDHAFAALVGAVAETSPKGHAVAGMDTAFCGVAPIMMCEYPDLRYRDIVTDPPGQRGRGIWLTSRSNGGPWGPGNFGLLAVDGALGEEGVSVLHRALGMANPPILCVDGKNLEVAPGNNSAARNGFNVRFDIYHGSLAAKAADGQWQPAANTVKGQIRTGCEGSGWNLPTTPYDGPGTMPDPPVMPLPRDSCTYPASASNPNGGTCLATVGQGGLGDGVWDYDTYMQINHPEIDPASARATMDRTGDGLPPYGLFDGLTRYDVYRWELGHAELSAYGPADYGTVGALTHHLVDNIGAIPADNPLELPVPLGPDPTPTLPQTAEYGGPQCFTGPVGAAGSVVLSRDRRVFALAMVDCQSQPIQGQASGVKAEGFVEVFALEPWTANGAEHEIHVELIGPVNDRDLAGTTVKRVVQLYE